MRVANDVAELEWLAIKRDRVDHRIPIDEARLHIVANPSLGPLSDEHHVSIAMGEVEFAAGEGGDAKARDGVLEQGRARRHRGFLLQFSVESQDVRRFKLVLHTSPSYRHTRRNRWYFVQPTPDVPCGKAGFR